MDTKKTKAAKSKKGAIRSDRAREAQAERTAGILFTVLAAAVPSWARFHPRRHWAYLRYVVRHKYFMLIAARRVGGVSLYRALVHDLSKFTPAEWGAYARTFFTEKGEPAFIRTDEFVRAWVRHMNRNPHHWQFWVYVDMKRVTRAAAMPEKYAREMVADWMAAGRAIHGVWEWRGWYAEHADKMVLHEDTRELVEGILAGAGAGEGGSNR